MSATPIEPREGRQPRRDTLGPTHHVIASSATLGDLLQLPFERRYEEGARAAAVNVDEGCRAHVVNPDKKKKVELKKLFRAPTNSSWQPMETERLPRGTPQLQPRGSLKCRMVFQRNHEGASSAPGEHARLQRRTEKRTKTRCA